MREIEADPAAKVAWEVQHAARKVRKAAKSAQQPEAGGKVGLSLCAWLDPWLQHY